MKPELTVSLLCEEANQFARIESSREHASLFGVTDGKAIGTYVEHQFREYLTQRYSFAKGSSARGIDFPDLAVDMKVTSIRHRNLLVPFNMYDRNLPVDEIEAYRIAQELLNNPPNIGYLTISNALQWRLQYRRIIEQAGQVEGILKIL